MLHVLYTSTFASFGSVEFVYPIPSSIPAILSESAMFIWHPKVWMWYFPLFPSPPALFGSLSRITPSSPPMIALVSSPLTTARTGRTGLGLLVVHQPPLPKLLLLLLLFLLLTLLAVRVVAKETTGLVFVPFTSFTFTFILVGRYRRLLASFPRFVRSVRSVAPFRLLLAFCHPRPRRSHKARKKRKT